MVILFYFFQSKQFKMQIKYLSIGLIAAVAASVLADPIANGVRVAGAGDAVIKHERRDLRIAKIYANAIRRRYTRRSEADEEEEDEEEEDEKEEDEPDEDEANESESQSLSRREEEEDEEEAEEDEPDEDEGPKKASANAATPRFARRQKEYI
jgi:Mg-chelatase subunit ChlI